MSELIELIKDFQPIDPARMNSPEGYLMQDNDLRAAANTALVLGNSPCRNNPVARWC